MRRLPFPRARILGSCTIVLAGVLSLWGVPVTSAQGQTLTATRVDGPLPVNAPFDPAWAKARGVEVAMTGQSVVQPMRMTASVPSIRVRALVNDDRVAVLLEWEDATVDESVAAPTLFSDAAAMQFALGSSSSICMGQLGGSLNIWHWKADWAAALDGRGTFDLAHPNMPRDVTFPVDAVDGMGAQGFLTGQAAHNPRSAARFPSSVEDLNAIGFGSLTSQLVDGQNVHGASEHRGRTWRVVMSRDVMDDDVNDARFQPYGAATAVAFAVWDGARGDRNGQKSVSSWIALAMPASDTGTRGLIFLPIAVLLLAIASFLAWQGAMSTPTGRGGDRPTGSGSGSRAG